MACPHISKRNSGRAALIFFPPCHPSRTWQRAELMCWRKAPYARREDYRGASSRSFAAEVNWFVLKYYIGIELIPAVVPLYGFRFRMSSCQNKWEARLLRCLCSLDEVMRIDVFFFSFMLPTFILLHWNMCQACGLWKITDHLLCSSLKKSQSNPSFATITCRTRVLAAGISPVLTVTELFIEHVIDIVNAEC